MKNKIKCIGIIVFMTVIGFSLTDCDSGGGGGAPALTGTVSITGTAKVGETLTADITGLDGTGTVTYQWKRGTTNIGTNSSTYIIVAADVGSTITVTVTRAGYTGSKISAPTAAVAALPQLTGTVTITGTAKVGETLMADITGLDGTETVTYQWKKGTTNIGTNSSTYIIVAADAGSTITVTVTRAGYTGSVTSIETSPVIIMAWVQTSNGFSNAVNDGNFHINDVAYGTNQYVAVCTTAYVTYSADGQTWTPVQIKDIFNDGGTTISLGVSINGIAYGSGKYIAVGNHGKMASSTNGSTWTEITNPFGTENINTVIYGDVWVAGGNNGSIAYSNNGTTWTNVSGSPFGSSAIQSIAYGNGRYIAVGANGKMYTSTTAITWTAVDVTSLFTYTYGGSSTVQTIQTVAYDHYTWIAAGGGGKMATSTNGTSWTAVADNTFGPTTIQTVAYGNNKWVAAGLSGKMATSTDGINWTSISNTSFASDDQINGIAFGNNKWVAVSTKGKIAYANDN